jgi:hypothetical protein
VASDVEAVSPDASVSKLAPLLRFVGTARKFCGLLHCVGDDMLCGLVGLDSRLSKLLLALNSVGVECAFELGRKFDGLLSSCDLPSSDRCSISWSGSFDVLLDDLCTADVSIVIVGALGLLAGPGDGDTRPAGVSPPFSAMLLRFLPHCASLYYCCEGIQL